MARINYNNIKRKEKNTNNIHDIVYATYHSFESFGEKYFQIDTYGKPTREVPKQSSQKIQFNKETAEKLIELLNKEFGIKNGKEI
jgi:broad-specificity NMP kinase